MREQAALLFRQASLISRMTMGKKGAKYSLMDEFEWLWSREEREQQKLDELERSLMSRATKTDSKPPQTLDEQDQRVQDAQGELERLMQAARRKATR